MTVIYLNPIYLPGQKLPPSAIAFLPKMLPLILSRQGETCVGCFQEVRVPRALWILLWLVREVAGGWQVGLQVSIQNFPLAPEE